MAELVVDYVISNGKRVKLKDTPARESIGSCSNLQTDTKHCLVDAVNELNQKLNSGCAKGDKGEPGKSAYEYAQAGGYTGTEEEFAAELANIPIDWFGDGSKIPANSDLDTVTAYGKYYVTQGDCKTIINSPVVNDSYVVFVFKRQSKAFNQLIFTYAGSIWYRGANTSGTLKSTWTGYAKQSALEDHTANKSNPHNVTAGQVGALPLSGGTMIGRLTLVGDPVSAMEAATKQYVDSKTTGAGSTVKAMTADQIRAICT